MPAALAVLTRDLRVHDNPVLGRALAETGQVVPVFVLDDAILRSGFFRPNRAAFLAESLADLDHALRARGSRLVVRRGQWARQVAALAVEAGAVSVHVARDVSGYAARRLDDLAGQLPRGVTLHAHDDSVVVVPPGRVTASGKNHMAVFTPYHRRWLTTPTRDLLSPPERLPGPRVRSQAMPSAAELVELCGLPPSPRRDPGGESTARSRLDRWLAEGIDAYAQRQDWLTDGATSRLSAYLHFGCLSPLETVRRVGRHGGAGAEAFIRQLAWRDFHAQLLAARPETAHADLHPRGDRWVTSAEELEAWRDGRTGYPIVDAAMRQLRQEGWMPNRARLVAGHFLVKTLYHDWREGAAHFTDWLVDADVANNALNWQWVAGTGTDSRFNRRYNVVAQARRHDPSGEYVRRFVPELADVDDAYVHEPWLLREPRARGVGYPEPIVDLQEAQQRLRQARGARTSR